MALLVFLVFPNYHLLLGTFTVGLKPFSVYVLLVVYLPSIVYYLVPFPMFEALSPLSLTTEKE
jgi:cellulose synthase/poly-beta-1,6-N-acetylglucosamine synthase-like glycosyltransferase